MSRHDVPKTTWYESNLLWGPVGILLTLVARTKQDLRWLLWFSLPCFMWVWWTWTKRIQNMSLRLILTGMCLLFVVGGLYGLNIWLRPKPDQIAPEVSQLSTSTAPQEQIVLTPATKPDPRKKKRPPRNNQNGRDRSVQQSNSGGINVQQTTTGDNSPIVNSPVTINPEPPERHWEITNDDCAKILGPVKSTHTGKPLEVPLGWFVSDPDGANVANQLIRCLPNAPGWHVTGALLPGVPEGITVVTSEEYMSVAESLRDGLRLVGFNAEVQLIPTSTDMEVWIGKHALKY
jgi:hypothetical protein